MTDTSWAWELGAWLGGLWTGWTFANAERMRRRIKALREADAEGDAMLEKVRAQIGEIKALKDSVKRSLAEAQRRAN
jgi:RPA family protein